MENKKKIQYILVGAALLFSASVIFFIFKNGIFTINDTQKPVEPTKDNVTMTFNAGDYGQSIELINEYLKDNPDDANAWAMRATVLANIGSVEFSEEENAQQAIESANKALAINPKQIDALYARGYAYEIQNKFEEALADYEKVLITEKNNPIYITQMGHLHDLMGHPEEAKKYYEQALAIDDTFSKALINMGRYYYRYGEAQKAEEYFEKALSYTLNEVEKSGIYYSLGMIAIERGEIQKSYNYMDQAISDTIESPQALIGRGWAALLLITQEGSDTVALQEQNITMEIAFGDVEKAIEIHPEQTMGYLTMARMYLRLPFFANESVQYYDKALEVIDDDITIMSNDKKTVREDIIKERAQAEEILSSEQFKNIKSQEHVYYNKHQKILTKIFNTIIGVYDVYAGSGWHGNCYYTDGPDYCYDMNAFNAWISYLNSIGHYTYKTNATTAYCNNGSWIYCQGCIIPPPPPPPCTKTWGAWSSCGNCVGGTQSRTATCPYDSQTRACSIKGACGVNYDSSGIDVVDKPLNGTESDLCKTGSISNFRGQGTMVDPYKWTCSGTGSCANAMCDAQLKPGSCGDDKKVVSYQYPQTNFPPGFNFCNPESAETIPSSVTLNQLPTDATSNSVATTTWDCKTINGGTTNHACKAQLTAPTVTCGSSSNSSELNTKPTGGLCTSSGGAVKVSSPGVKLDSDGNWVWGCEHSKFSNIKVNACKRPTCIANNPINATSPIMLSEEEMKSQITLNCPGPGGDKLCCKVTNDKNKATVTVCSGKSGEIKIEPGQNDLKGICWFVGNNGGGNGNGSYCNGTGAQCITIKNAITVYTACLQSQCTASGTCTKTPKLAELVSQCESSCNSNADCTSGRMIETKP